MSFSNKLIVDKIFQYIPVGDRLRYLLISQPFNQWIFDNVLVEFSIDKYLVWLITSKSYEPLSFARLIYWKIAPMYIPSKMMENLESILQFLQMEHFKRVRVVLINRQVQKYQISAAELSNRLSVYLMLHDRLTKYFKHIEELVIRDMTLKLNLNQFHGRNEVRYMDLDRTRVEGNLPDGLQTLIIDVTNLLRTGNNKLKYLKHLQLYIGDNMGLGGKILNELDWKSRFPSLEVLVIGQHYDQKEINLTGLNKLKHVIYTPLYDNQGSKIFTHDDVLVVPSSDDTKEYVQEIFERSLIDQQEMFRELIP